jgi:hypothetical protein
MRSPFFAPRATSLMSLLGLTGFLFASFPAMAQMTEPSFEDSPPTLGLTIEPEPLAIAQWIQPQEERFEAQREAERQRAREQLETMRQRLQDSRQTWQTDSLEWRSRREALTERVQDQADYHSPTFQSDLYRHETWPYRYSPYGDRWSRDTLNFRIRYQDANLDIEYGSRIPYGDRIYRENVYYYPRVIDRGIDRVYVPYPIPQFGNNSFVQMELVSETRGNVTVMLVGADGNQQLAFDALNQSQSVYLAAGTYRIAFIDSMNNRTWLSGYLDLGFSPVVRIEFNQGTSTANLYGDPYAWRAE